MKHHTSFYVCLAVVAVGSYFTYAYRYYEPAELFWDEHYHVASAEKYLQGVFYFETHPPLGKLLIALGEWLLQPNAGIDKSWLARVQLSDRDLPEGFSLAGYRLIPAVAGFLNGPLFFACLYSLSRRPILSAGLASLYLFDNALIVHSRGAMLDGIQISFILLGVLVFLQAMRRPRWGRRLAALSLAFGLCTGLAAMTKLNGLILCLFGLPAAVRLRRPAAVVQAAGCFALGLALPVLLVWHIHFALGGRFATDNRFGLPADLAAAVERGEAARLSFYPRLFAAAHRYLWRDNDAVPELDEFDPLESGSWWYLWPVGGHAINYRWFTPDGERFRFLYLQANPASWGCALLGVAYAAAMLLAWAVGEHRFRSPRRQLLCASFLLAYAAYLAAMAWIEQRRVMYLYHYFVPLLFGFLLFALFVLDVERLFVWRLGRRARAAAVLGVMLAVYGSFVFYSPLTYYRPITLEQLERRAWLRVWRLEPPPEERSPEEPPDPSDGASAFEGPIG